MEIAPYAIGGLIVLCVGFAIWVAVQDNSNASVLTPLGVILAIAGFGGAIAAFMMDITPGYDDEVVNMDAVGQRTMYFVAASAIFVAGMVLAAVGHAIDTLRPRPQPEDRPSAAPQDAA